MSAYLVKGIMFDLYMTLMIFAYLGALWLYILILREGWVGARLKLPKGLRNPSIPFCSGLTKKPQNDNYSSRCRKEAVGLP